MMAKWERLALEMRGRLGKSAPLGTIKVTPGWSKYRIDVRANFLWPYSHHRESLFRRGRIRLQGAVLYQ